MEYIFAYGTLINSTSRERNTEKGHAFPCCIKGFERGWYFFDEKEKSMALGLISREKARCNGVLFHVKRREMLSLDVREGGYKRIQLDYNRINLDIANISRKDTIWTYILEDTTSPSRNRKIPQSYIDIALTGCFEFGYGFAKEFLETTTNWSCNWANDRGAPLLNHLKEKVIPYAKIDKLIEDTLGVHYIECREG